MTVAIFGFGNWAYYCVYPGEGLITLFHFLEDLLKSSSTSYSPLDYLKVSSSICKYLGFLQNISVTDF